MMRREDFRIIPRFAVPYRPGDFAAAASALLARTASSPEGMSKVIGGGRKFWTASGRQALWLILKALQLGRGAGIAVPLYCDFSVASAIQRAGYSPVFVDIEEDTLTLDPAALHSALDRVHAIVVPHLFGQVARMAELMGAAGGLPVIEDTAHAPLSTLNGRAAGTFGLACFYSFASTKYWPAGGGGVAVVHDPHLAEGVGRAAQALVPQGFGERIGNLLAQGAKALLFRRWSYGALSIPLRRWAEPRSLLEPELDAKLIQPGQAAVALRQCARFSERVRRQRKNSLRLLAHLSALEDGDIVIPRERPEARYNYHLFPVLLRDRQERDAVAKRMLARGVDTSRIYFDVVGHARRLGYQGGCPISEGVANRLLTLPNYASLSGADISRVADAFVWALRTHRTEMRGRSVILPPLGAVTGVS